MSFPLQPIGHANTHLDSGPGRASEVKQHMRIGLQAIQECSQLVISQQVQVCDNQTGVFLQMIGLSLFK